MSDIVSKLCSRKWASVLPVTGGTPQQFAHEEPKEDYNSDSCFGLHRPSYGAVTAVSAVAAPVSNTATAIPEVQSLSDDEVFPAGRPRLVLDLETYYASDYNLDKLDTAGYVLDPRFHVHGIAVAYPDGRTEFRTDVEALLEELRQAYGERLERVAVVMHNSYFDFFILYHRHGLEIAHVIDTMLLSRLLHGSDEDHSLRALATHYGLPAKGDLEFMKGVRDPDAGQLDRLREYAATDAAITAGLADILVPLAADHPVELWAMNHSVKMFVERPLAVDAAMVSAAQAKLESSITEKVIASGLDEATIRSTKKFPEALAAALAKSGRSLPTKPGSKGPIPAIAKDDHARDEMLTDSDPAVRTLMEAKVALSSASGSRGRLKRLAGMARMTGCNGHFQHSYHRAGTGRYAGADGFNIQNLKHGDGEDDNVASLIRRSIQAPSGKVMVSADASQIEARVLAYLSGQQDLHDAFGQGRDVYSLFASAQFRREVRKPKDNDTPEYAAELKRYRQIGKQAILGLGFGMGVGGFIRTSRAKPELAGLFDSGLLNDATCAAIVFGYKDLYPKIKQFWGDCEDAVRGAIAGSPAEVSGMRFSVKEGTLLIRLRSGREIVYPRIREQTPTYETFTYIDRYGVRQTAADDRPTITYGDGFELYGGKIVENIVQATSRDLLVEAMYRLESTGLKVFHHCHDAVAVIVPKGESEMAKARLLGEWRRVPEWARGLVLDAEAKSGPTLADV